METSLSLSRGRPLRYQRIRFFTLPLFHPLVRGALQGESLQDEPSPRTIFSSPTATGGGTDEVWFLSNRKVTVHL